MKIEEDEKIIFWLKGVIYKSMLILEKLQWRNKNFKKCNIQLKTLLLDFRVHSCIVRVCPKASTNYVLIIVLKESTTGKFLIC